MVIMKQNLLLCREFLKPLKILFHIIDCRSYQTSVEWSGTTHQRQDVSYFAASYINAHTIPCTLIFSPELQCYSDTMRRNVDWSLGNC